MTAMQISEVGEKEISTVNTLSCVCLYKQKTDIVVTSLLSCNSNEPKASISWINADYDIT